MTTLLADADDIAKKDGKSRLIWLVNGQLNPTMTILGGEWYRLRIVFAAIRKIFEMVPSGNEADCQLRLLAKDGIYLNTIPRVVEEIILFPGARADVALKCTCTSYPCKATSAADGSESNIFSFNIVQGSQDAPDLEEFTPRRPCYL